MTATANIAAAGRANGIGDRSVGRFSKRSVTSRIMAECRGWWRSKVPVQLAGIIGCDVRSAERYLSGDRTMGGEAVFALLRSQVGVKMVEAAVADLPDRERDQFWREMAMAVVKAQIRDDVTD